MRNITTALLLAIATHMMPASDWRHLFPCERRTAPDGTEWQDPENLSLGKEHPRAYMCSFPTEEEALRVLPCLSSFALQLDGLWKFHWAPDPDHRPTSFQDPQYDVAGWDDIPVPGCWNVQGLRKDGTMKYGVPIYVNQPVIFQHEVKPDDWRQGVMREPRDHRWTTYEHRNEVGSYRRQFSIPTTWKGKQVLIHFDGVDSFFYLWINGHYVGFSKNSRNTASFDITPFLSRKGSNVVAVEVYRNSDGSFLEAQDMFRLPGIYRSVYLTCRDQMHFEDLRVSTLKGTTTQRVWSKVVGGEGSIDYAVYPVELYSDETGEAVYTTSCKVNHDLRLGQPQPSDHGEALLAVPDAKLWSAEKPHRYVLTATLKDKKGKVRDIVSTYFGICNVEIKDTPASEDEFGKAGRYFYVNGKPVKLKGVNRHETNPTLGHAITRKQMEEEVMLMKRANINHVRLSHYSNDPYFYYLADKYGLYLEDECNIESHEYYYGEASLSHPKEWRAAHIARNLEMVHSHINHPSIVIWSLGNEAGPGDNFAAAYAAIKEVDPRPVQYERNNNIVDMGSNQYPSVEWVRWVAQGTAGVKYPFHISEYAHSMGNSLGNLVDYWEAMESTNYFCGGAIWDWVDQAIDTYTPDGQHYMGYGGDHGDWPNDGMFCMNGIMLPDLTPKPQYFEVKKVYQNVGVRSLGLEDGGKRIALEIFNKQYFEPLDYDVVASLYCQGMLVGEQRVPATDIAPRQKRVVRLPLQMEEGKDDYCLNIEFRLRHDMPWATKGYAQMAEQIELRRGAEATPYHNIAVASHAGGGAPRLTEGEAQTVVDGNNFQAVFDNATGSLWRLTYNDHTLIEDGCGPKLDAFRAPVDNDNWAWNQWFQNGLYDLHHRTTAPPIVVSEWNGGLSLIYNVWSQATHQGRVIHRPGKAGEPFERIEQGRQMGDDDFHFLTTQRYTIHPDGTIELTASIVSSDPSLPLPRLGYAMKLPSHCNQYTYYGRGPLNNYADRKTGSFVGLYKSTVEEQFVPFPKPQSMGNREDVSWCALTTEEGYGLLFVADYAQRMSVSALPWSALQMTLAAHPHELPKSDGTYLHLDCQVTGLGGNSCGQGGPLEHDRVSGPLHQMSFAIRRLFAPDDAPKLASVRLSQRYPVTITRDRAGKVSITGDKRLGDTSLCYTLAVAGEKATRRTTHRYSEPFSLREGGTVSAWYEDEEEVKTTATFPRVENVPVTIAYVSSEEGPGGELASNLVDGNPNTMWHTMYSITVPKYPHWVDFDCGEEKTIKGFAYLPRQDGGSNGNIKDYKVELSLDGKTWSAPVAQGTFDNNAKEKRVMLQSPQRARYLRFTALSSQNGADFASGAEFTVLAE